MLAYEILMQPVLPYVYPILKLYDISLCFTKSDVDFV